MVSLQLPVAVYISIYGASALCKQLLLLHDLLPGLILCLTLKLHLLVNPLGPLDAPSAQQNMKETAQKDTSLLAQAKEHAKLILQGYINNLGEEFNEEYTIKWVDVSE